MLDLKKLWDDALADIELTIPKAQYSTWFSRTRAVKHDSGTIYLGVPNSFVKEWLVSKHHKLILKSLRQIEPDIRALEYLIVQTEDLHRPRPTTPTSKPPQAAGQLEMAEIYINRDDNLNPKYIFDSFVVGPFNELAHAATQAVVKKLGLVYNPLFIYGPTGVGKTHLLQSAGNHIKHHTPQKKVYYVTSEQFLVDYINSLQNNRGNLFKEKYRKYDMLIMDDVQFLAGKDKIQEELFHLFNNFSENNKQIIFSSDKPPHHIPNLEDRLRSRFAGGMIVDVARPDYESRLAILNSKVRHAEFQPGDEVIKYLAENIQDSIRELEGSLNTIICQCQLKNRPMTVVEVKQLIKNNIKPKKMLSLKNLAEVVANFYNIPEKSLYDRSRKKEVVKPRQVIMFLMREDFNSSYPFIGQKMGGRDHTTVIHAYEKIKSDLKVDNSLNQEVEQIRLMLYAE